MARKPIPESGALPVSVDAWLDELAALARKSDEGRTCAELAEAAGVTLPIMRTRLQRAHAAGRLVPGKRAVTYIDGRRSFVPVYRVLRGPGKSPGKSPGR